MTERQIISVDISAQIDNSIMHLIEKICTDNPRLNFYDLFLIHKWGKGKNALPRNLTTTTSQKSQYNKFFVYDKTLERPIGVVHTSDWDLVPY